jgi:phosphatidylinositol-3-phosphatase
MSSSPRQLASRIGSVLASAALVLLMSPTPGSAAPSGVVPASAPTHLVVIFDENKESSEILGNPSAPFLNSLANAGRYFDNYYAVAHPSLPDYLAFASGSTEGKVGTDGVSPGQISATTLWDQLTNAGISWKVYAQMMPSTCYDGTNYVNQAKRDQYVLRHNPALPYHGVLTTAECQNVVPYSEFDPRNLPTVSFISPSMCHDMHGLDEPWAPDQCAPGTDALVSRGDTWLANHVPAMIAGGADVLVTFDEGHSDEGLGGTPGGGHVYAVEAGPDVSPGTDMASYDHYSLLAGIEDAYGLARLGNAASATPLPI